MGDPDAKDLILQLCRIAREERLTAIMVTQHAFVLKNHLGRPTDIVPVTANGLVERGGPPPTANHPQGDYFALLLDSKSRLELQMLDAQTELEDVTTLLHKERERSKQFEAAAAANAEELDKVHERMRQMADELSRLRNRQWTNATVGRMQQMGEYHGDEVQPEGYLSSNLRGA